MATSTSAPSGLSVIWNDIVNAFQQGEQFVMTFLTNVANGGEILVADIESVAQYIAGHVGIINSTVAAVTAAANSIAPGNANVAKVTSDLQVAANDVAALSQAINTGSSAGSDQVVSTAVAAINAVKTTSALAAQAAAAIAQLTQASPTATQAVTPASPSSNA